MVNATKLPIQDDAAELSLQVDANKLPIQEIIDDQDENPQFIMTTKNVHQECCSVCELKLTGNTSFCKRVKIFIHYECGVFF